MEIFKSEVSVRAWNANGRMEILPTLLFILLQQFMSCVGGKRRRQVYREDVTPAVGGRIPSGAFDLGRLLYNNLDSRGISIPDGLIPSSDRNGEGRIDDSLTLFSASGDESMNIPSTYRLRHPVGFPLFPNPDEKPNDITDGNDPPGFDCSEGVLGCYSESHDHEDEEFPADLSDEKPSWWTSLHHNHNGNIRNHDYLHYQLHQQGAILPQPLNNDETYFHSAANFPPFHDFQEFPHLKDLHVMKNYVHQKPRALRRFGWKSWNWKLGKWKFTSPAVPVLDMGRSHSNSNYMRAEKLPFLIIATPTLTHFKDFSHKNKNPHWKLLHFYQPKTTNEIWDAKYIIGKIMTL